MRQKSSITNGLQQMKVVLNDLQLLQSGHNISTGLRSLDILTDVEDQYPSYIMVRSLDDVIIGQPMSFRRPNSVQAAC